MHTKIEEIRKYFGDVKANDGISFTLEPGRVYGLLGENGAGKSTLMKILSGFQPPDSGQIILDGQPTKFESPRVALLPDRACTPHPASAHCASASTPAPSPDRPPPADTSPYPNSVSA